MKDFYFATEIVIRKESDGKSKNEAKVTEVVLMLPASWYEVTAPK